MVFSQAYITGNAFSILGDPETLLQTVYDDDEQPLEAIALDEASGKIAVCTANAVRIYRPFGQEEDALRVCRSAWAKPLTDRCADSFRSGLCRLPLRSSEEMFRRTTIHRYPSHGAHRKNCWWRIPP